ncbi:MAG: histidinol-phosphate aminotransferase family protein [Gemmatimonadetes bacterium]|nr:histidinol-phosphate aminotransferase family protein [Gemmatimonadota bacterium]
MTTPWRPRDDYRNLKVYRTEAGPVEIDLSDNTSLFGSAPSALAEIAAFAHQRPARYPSAGTGPLREGLADWLGVRPENVVGGCGSNDVLDASMRALGEPGWRLAFPAPTFVMTPHFAAANSLRPIGVPVLADGAADVDGLLATGAELIYLASPNNPSGKAASADAIDRLLERAPRLVILDEAYVEFAGGSRVLDAVASGRAVVTRTFSKVWGLAGLRVGYAVGAPALIEEIEKARGPYKVNALAERASAAAVRHDRQWLAGVVRDVREAREELRGRLASIGYSSFGSDANFIAVSVPDAPGAAAALARGGIAVRAFPNAPVLGDLLRITVAPAPICDRLVAAFRELPR